MWHGMRSPFTPRLTFAPDWTTNRDANTQSVRRRGAATTFQLPVRSPASVGVGEGVDWGKEVGDLPMEDRVTFRGAPERQNSSGVGQKPSGAPRQRPVSCRSARSQTFLAAQPVQIVQLPYKVRRGQWGMRAEGGPVRVAPEGPWRGLRPCTL